MKELENVTGTGGFKLKDLRISGQVSNSEDLVSFQVYNEVENELGLNWCLVNNELFVKLEISDEDKKLCIC